MTNVVTIASFNEPLEAEMVRLRLESRESRFSLRENARIMEPGLGRWAAGQLRR